MAKKPKTVTLGRHEYRVLGERPGWIAPTDEQYAQLFRVIIGLVSIVAIGVARAWWKLHH